MYVRITRTTKSSRQVCLLNNLFSRHHLIAPNRLLIVSYIASVAGLALSACRARAEEEKEKEGEEEEEEEKSQTSYIFISK